MTSSPVEEILGQLPLDQIAQQLGVDEATAGQAAAAVIPSLIGGLQHNADTGHEQAIAGALTQHSASGLFGTGQVDVNAVDTQDGAKIVQHIFGDQSPQLAQAIGQRTGTSGSLVQQLLPILAPIVMAYLAKKLTGQQSAGGGGGFGDILGSILGGGAQQAGSGGMLGSILGGILSGGGLESVLGAGSGMTGPTSAPAPGAGGIFSPGGDAGVFSSGPATGDASQLQVDEPQQPGEPQSGGSIVDEILGNLFGKR